METNSKASVKSMRLISTIKLLTLFVIVFLPNVSKAQFSGNFFFSIMDSLEASPQLAWVQFDEKSLKSLKSYQYQKKAPLKTLIEAGFLMPEEDVANEYIAGLLKRKYASALMFALANENFKHTEEKLKSEKLPVIFKYLPVALSAMNVKQEWNNGAGIWHFYFPQAIKAGLNISIDKDERLDNKKSSDAAIKQLKKIYVAQKNNATETILIWAFGKNYQSLSNTPSNYHPEAFLQTFINIANIMESRQIPVFSDAMMVYPPISTVNPEKQLRLNLKNKEYPFNIRQLAYLNPTYTSGFVPAGDIINIATADTAHFNTWLNSEQVVVKEVESIEKISHRIKSGETLSLIANKYHVRISDIKEWNKLKSDLIREGQVLIIYKK
jgi:membrane-bound lytic murein transglycosylase D